MHNSTYGKTPELNTQFHELVSGCAPDQARGGEGVQGKLINFIVPAMGPNTLTGYSIGSKGHNKDIALKTNGEV